MAGSDSLCSPELDYGRARRRAPDYRRFQETKISLGIALIVDCNVLVNPAAIQSIEITGRFAYETGEEGDTGSVQEVGAPDTVSVDAPPFLGERKVRGFTTDCELRMAGTKRYHLTGTVKVRLRGLPDRTDSFITDDYVRFTCPSQAQRLRWQEQGWQALLKESSDYLTDPNKRGTSTARDWLADDMGPRPYTPPGVRPGRGWQAHHTVPIGRPDRARDFHALLFRACIHPNERGNGVYLRARPLRRLEDDGSPNPRYERLRRHDRDTGSRLAQRTYHADTQRFIYYQRVREGLRRALSTHNSNCTEGGAGGRSQVLSDLSALASKLIAGRLALGKPRR